MSAASVCNGLKQIIFFGAFSIFESGGITKHLVTGPSGNSEFCFPSRVSGKQNSLFSLWQVIKCLLLKVICKEIAFSELNLLSIAYNYKS